MAELGRTNTLTIVKQVDFGVYLDGGEWGQVLLPGKEVPENAEVGDAIEVFLYLDSEQLPLATRVKPLAQVGEFAFLEVAAVNRTGAFMEWGLPKQLLVPFANQRRDYEVGETHLVYLYVDPHSDRIVASGRTHLFTDRTPPTYKPGQAVELLITRKTELGYSAIIEHAHTGLLFEQEVFKPLQRGDRLTGYIRRVREDGKIDLTLTAPGRAQIEPLAQQILDKLAENEGFLALNDKSDPKLIARLFGVSKKQFKQAIGNLYRQRHINITARGIERLTD